MRDERVELEVVAFQYVAVVSSPVVRILAPSGLPTARRPARVVGERGLEALPGADVPGDQVPVGSHGRQRLAVGTGRSRRERSCCGRGAPSRFGMSHARAVPSSLTVTAVVLWSTMPTSRRRRRARGPPGARDRSSRPRGARCRRRSPSGPCAGRPVKPTTFTAPVPCISASGRFLDVLQTRIPLSCAAAMSPVRAQGDVRGRRLFRPGELPQEPALVGVPDPDASVLTRGHDARPVLVQLGEADRAGICAAFRTRRRRRARRRRLGAAQRQLHLRVRRRLLRVLLAPPPPRPRPPDRLQARVAHVPDAHRVSGPHFDELVLRALTSVIVTRRLPSPLNSIPNGTADGEPAAF